MPPPPTPHSTLFSYCPPLTSVPHQLYVPFSQCPLLAVPQITAAIPPVHYRPIRTLLPTFVLESLPPTSTLPHASPPSPALTHSLPKIALALYTKRNSAFWKWKSELREPGNANVSQTVLHFVSFTCRKLPHKPCYFCFTGGESNVYWIIFTLNSREAAMGY